MAMSRRAGAPRVSAVVPSLGESPWLDEALAALAAQRPGGGFGGSGRPGGGGVAEPRDLEIVLVWQGAGEPPAGADRVLRPQGRLGFAAATNLGLRESRGELIATVNDDAMVEPGWAAALVELLDARPAAAAAQGVNLAAGAPTGTGSTGADLSSGGSADGPATTPATGATPRVDGCGIGWNRRWQAVQVGHGGPPPAADTAPREIFGASATAAIFRRSALEAVAGERSDGDGVFDERLGSWYEDVDLAIRLRHRGHTAFLVPAARARHLGSATGGRRPARRALHLYANRHLVLAHLLGDDYSRRLPRLLASDLGDLLRLSLRGSPREAAGVVAGWGRAARRLPAHRRKGPPLFSREELVRFPG